MKGPAHRMLARPAGGTSAAHVARVYTGLVDALVIDGADAGDADAVGELVIRPIVTDTLMRDSDVRRRLVEATLEVVALR